MSRARVLCYGDSNTWGCRAEDGSRLAEDVRWTGRLQRLLGSEVVVIEEGLNGRTCNRDYRDRVGKNGKTYLLPCLDSHFPLDAMVLCLGTNDCKVEFGLTPEQIAAGLEELVLLVHSKKLDYPSPGMQLVVAAPTLIIDEHLDSDTMVGGEAKTRALPALYRAIAARHGATFVDLSAIPPSPVDGCHLDPEAHAEIAERIHAALTPLLPNS